MTDEQAIKDTLMYAKRETESIRAMLKNCEGNEYPVCLLKISLMRWLIIEDALEKYDAETCTSCKYSDTKPQDNPCKICSRRYRDNWTNKDSDKDWYD